MGSPAVIVSGTRHSVTPLILLAIIVSMGADCSPLRQDNLNSLTLGAIADCREFELKETAGTSFGDTKVTYRCVDEVSEKSGGNPDSDDVREEADLLTTEECPEGFTFNSGKGRCFRNELTFPVNVEAGETVGNPRCEDGSVFDPEKEKCLPAVPALSQFHVHEHAVPFKRNKTKCPPGFVYVSEIDHCVPFPKRPTTTEDPKEPPVKALVQERSSDSRFSFSELPSNDDPQVPHATEDPIPLTLRPLHLEQVGRRKCKEGTVYVSEVDLCLEP